MLNEIKTISSPLPYRLGSVNSYLLKTESGHVLIDTGARAGRAALDRGLLEAGCRAGTLGLILLTHGDFDHIGNAAYLSARFRTRIAMHGADAGMAERGDMFWNRKKANVLLRTLVPLLFGFGKMDRFTPDLCVEDGCDLSPYGLDARVLHLPGHSSGSIGILTSHGDLFAGDLFSNTGRPALNDMMDDMSDARASLGKLKGFEIRTVYPGHGKPFPMAQVA